MLDAVYFPEHPLLLGHDRDQITVFGQTLSPTVEVLIGYLDNDFTVFMHKARKGQP